METNRSFRVQGLKLEYWRKGEVIKPNYFAQQVAGGLEEPTMQVKAGKPCQMDLLVAQ